jgi:hypothetical protein
MKWGSRNETLFYNITIMGNQASTYDGLPCNPYPRTNLATDAAVSCTSLKQFYMDSGVTDTVHRTECYSSPLTELKKLEWVTQLQS